jgi:catechol 2,3-dioxygenase-like lactoylglutathione lyase family enzyme
MAGKKAKKARKAEKKARKAAKKAAQKAAKLAQKTPQKVKKVERKAARKVEKAVKKATKKASRAARTSRAAFRDRKQPESLRLRTAGPSLTVNDIQKSLAFYRDVLGFTPKDSWEEDGAIKGMELLAGSVRFWLSQDDFKKGRDRVKGLGFRMYCGTTQDIDALAARLRAAGVELAEEPKDQSWGGRDFAVRDPDGFLITISSGL